VDIDIELAMKIWNDVFGADKTMVLDCFGTYICKADYGNHEKKRQAPDGKSYYYGWDLDHIRPRSSFPQPEAGDLFNNLEPIHWLNNQEKSDQYPHFKIDGKSYQIVKCGICAQEGEEGYGVLDSNGNRIDWKGVSKRFYSTKNN